MNLRPYELTLYTSRDTALPFLIAGVFLSLFSATLFFQNPYEAAWWHYILLGFGVTTVIYSLYFLWPRHRVLCIDEENIRLESPGAIVALLWEDVDRCEVSHFVNFLISRNRFSAHRYTLRIFSKRQHRPLIHISINDDYEMSHVETIAAYIRAIKEYKKSDSNVAALDNILAYRIQLDSFPKKVTL